MVFYDDLESITVITTYRCTAACKDCCFECSPELSSRLKLETIISFIDESVSIFKNLKLVVFTGGEPTLIGKDLYKAIRHATDLNLMTRVVSNGHWGRRSKVAQHTANEFKAAGLTEINLSTGKDHAEYVPVETVIGAITALSNAGIPNRITIESENEEGTFKSMLLNHPAIQDVCASNPGIISFQSNSWMPFHHDSIRRPVPPTTSLEIPCGQILSNLVITPKAEVASCCGLTFEHIPQLKLGQFKGGDVRNLYASQFEDFLKVWIRVDGPYLILKKVMGESYLDSVGDINHICQACAFLHKDQAVLSRLMTCYHEYVGDVMSEYYLQAEHSKIKRRVLEEQTWKDDAL